MNFNLIKEKYPKAFDIWIKSELSMMDVKNDRHLYDFFDEQGIYINVACFADNETPRIFSWRIEGITIEETAYKTRIEAEEQAFIQAFEILEEKLK